MTNTKEQTLAIIKPDAVGSNDIGSIIECCELEGLSVAGMMMTQLTKDEAQTFYLVHKERPFYNDLVKFMTSGPVVIMVLEGENAVDVYRKLMGATDPAKAGKDTIRGKIATSIECNAVHGSDSKENAKIEIDFAAKKGVKTYARS